VRKHKPKSLAAWKSFATDIIRWLRSDRDLFGSEMVHEEIMPILAKHGLAEYRLYDAKRDGQALANEEGLTDGEDMRWFFTRDARKYRRRT
jgi:hypothetical protein